MNLIGLTSMKKYWNPRMHWWWWLLIVIVLFSADLGYPETFLWIGTVFGLLFCEAKALHANDLCDELKSECAQLKLEIERIKTKI